MKFGKIFEKVKAFFKKLGKKNIIIACSALLICTAIYLNWALFASPEKSAKGDAEGVSKGGQNSEQVDNTENNDDAYFSASQVSRERARAEAMEVLQAVVDNSEAVGTVKDQALTDISRIALDIEKEANIETLIKSKGFADCVAVVSGASANVIVKTDGLLPNEVAQITEIVYEQAGIQPSNLKIVEKK